MTQYPFPSDFLWGAATAAHQIEGNNINSDWWQQEIAVDSKLDESSGDAVDSFNRYPEDIALLAQFGLKVYRFSIEWARIEPTLGKFSAAMLAHYQRMLDVCDANGVEAVVTLHHFTVPNWFAQLGGWRNPEAPKLFANYVEAVMPLLRGRVRYIVTINEPNILSMLAGGEKSDQQLAAGSLPAPDPLVSQALIASHKRAVEICRQNGFKAGWSVAPQQFFADPGAEEILREYAYPREVQFLEASRMDDFIGVQAYTRTRITAEGPLPAPESVERTLTGWEYYPPAIAEAALQAWEICQIPVFVTENGIATADDTRRIDYTREALKCLHREMEAGLPLLGYLHWSLLDNYEWGSFAPTFGLIAVDRQTFERFPKPSLAWLGGVARDGGL